MEVVTKGKKYVQQLQRRESEKGLDRHNKVKMRMNLFYYEQNTQIEK